MQFSLGNLDSKRDWGHARDYVEASSSSLPSSLSLSLPLLSPMIPPHVSPSFLPSFPPPPPPPPLSLHADDACVIVSQETLSNSN